MVVPHSVGVRLRIRNIYAAIFEFKAQLYVRHAGSRSINHRTLVTHTTRMMIPPLLAVIIYLDPNIGPEKGITFGTASGKRGTRLCMTGYVCSARVLVAVRRWETVYMSQFEVVFL